MTRRTEAVEQAAKEVYARLGQLAEEHNEAAASVRRWLEELRKEEDHHDHDER